MTHLASLAAEWQRIDILGRCLINNRRGQLIPESIKLRLKSLQEVVVSLRQTPPWQVLIRDKKLDPVDQDILACVVAPLAEPRLGWMFQELQPGIAGAYPTSALIRELLFIEGKEITSFYSRITQGAPLIRFGLVTPTTNDAYVPLKPGKTAVDLLLGLSVDKPLSPPGTMDISAPVEWQELVLPEYCLNVLQEFMHWVNYRDHVITKWGGKKVGGPVALFTGQSGTGKTFSAQVIAHALGYPLYRVDLGMLVSKYIGETEKNLNALFDAANNEPVVLLFDEAESIFGKRGEIKDARDRYANMEISHLLSRIEYHNGPCILTTNLQDHLDSAFTRRFQFVLEFPRPNQEARVQLWQKHMPPRAPISPDVDFEMLGESINLTGGQIRNAALHAAFLSAAENESINLHSLARATWNELGKEGRGVMSSNLGFLSDYLTREDRYAENRAS